jgi:serine/threonine-protein kinase RsbW
MPADRDGPPVEVGQATVSGGPRAPFVARWLVTRWLDGHGYTALVDDACLLVTELVTNSIVHAGQPAGAPVQIQAIATDRVVRFEVQDLGHGRVRARAPAADGGFGLHLVDRLAARWGVNHEGGTEVWFELTA